MRVAVIELFVAVRPERWSKTVDEGEALRSALFRDPQRRNQLAVEAIEASAELKPDVIVCPGWTFVGPPPLAGELVRMTGGATLLYEVLTEAGTVKAMRKAKGVAVGGVAAFPYVLIRGVLSMLPMQVFAVSAELDAPDALDNVARPFATAVLSGRNISHGIVLLCERSMWSAGAQ
jgi:hypothetical protein